MTSNISDLLPCPFCGCEAEIKYHNGGWPDACYSVQCNNWKCPGKTSSGSQDVASESWNTRASLTPSEPVVEVKEGYEVETYHWDGSDPNDCPLSEALTIRTADEVRREALEEAFKVSGEYHQITHVREAIRALIDTPAPSSEKSEPSPEPVAVRCDYDGYGYRYLDSGSGSDWLTQKPDAEPLYASPHDKTMGVAEAVKALEELHVIKTGPWCGGYISLKSATTALRALATQTGGE